MKRGKYKLFWFVVAIIIGAGALTAACLINSYTHQSTSTLTTGSKSLSPGVFNPTSILPSPDFGGRYASFAEKTCPFSGSVDAVDQGNCVTKLAEATQAEADKLAGRLVQAPISENYINDYCSIDAKLLEGGSGTREEYQACHYYYALQYLDLLKQIEIEANNTSTLGG